MRVFFPAFIRFLRVLFGIHNPETHAQVLLILGGCRERELAAAAAAREMLPLGAIVLSSGAATQREIEASAPDGVPVFIDGSATCTVSNFTTLAGALAAAGVHSVSVATSAGHRSRAAWVGTLVLTVGYAIQLSHVWAVGPAGPPESCVRLLRDCARAVLWLVTGCDGSRVGAAIVHPQRWRDARAFVSFDVGERERLGPAEQRGLGQLGSQLRASMHAMQHS